MRLVFAGTPQFAAQALGALIDTGHEIVSVLTQPDRKAGRGLRSIPGPVKALAIEHGLQVLQPVRLNDPATVEHLRSLTPELMVVAAYGLILPQAVLDLAPRGAINIHASLLPRWRGAAPIQRAILAGDTRTGITLMQMDAGLDTGAMLAQDSITVSPDETAGSLHDRLAALGARMTVDLLRKLQSEAVMAKPQPGDGVTYARKIDKNEALLDWRKSWSSLDREIRAFNPVPGARTSIDGFEVKVWRAQPLAGSGEPGLIQSAGDEGVVVFCGDGALVLTELQRAGGKRLGAREFLRGHPLSSGSRFELPAV
jgi:methionyl-tRNA formyltransferase